MKFDAVVVGSSAGGLAALKRVLTALPEDFPAPVLIVQHLSPRSDGFIIKYLDELCRIEVREAEEKTKPKAGCAYIAPPNYHLLVEKDGSLSLSVEEKVNFARPSIDILFETASDAFGSGLIGIVLTGANSDGSKGLKKIKERQGVAIVQDPEEAEATAMPIAAIETVGVDYILKLDEIGEKLKELMGG